MYQKLIMALPTAGLIAVAAVWGSTFFLIKDLTAHVPAMDFLAVRFLVAGALAMAVFARRFKGLGLGVWKHGAILGVIYGLAQIAQTFGLAHTDASVSGFITGMYVVLTPIVAWVLLKDKIPGFTWFAVGVAIVGLMILSLEGLSVGFGEMVTMLGALGYALHIVMLSRWSKEHDILALTAVQLLTVGLFCLPFALQGGITLPSTTGMWVSFMYMAIVAGFGAILVQTWSQSRISATRTAIIMTCEPVFASAFAVAFGGEHVTWRLLLGGSLVLGAMFLAELVPYRMAQAHLKATPNNP